MYVYCNQTKVKFYPRRASCHYCISGNKIERVRTYKCLGLGLDESLTWECHVSIIISEVTKVIGVLRRLKPLLPQSTLVLIYNSLTQPHFDYCSIVWDSLVRGLGQKLQRLQNRAARIITGSDYNTRSSHILASLNWTNLETRRTQQLNTFMYKTVNKMVPIATCLENLFQLQRHMNII